jgi:hypothetical protein
MKILSIDVGIKNLAYCLMESSISPSLSPSASLQGTNTIIQWDVINLCGEIPKCSIENCNNPSKYANHCHSSSSSLQSYLCLKHSKKSGLIIPTSNLSLPKIKKMKLADLNNLIVEYTIPLTTNTDSSIVPVPINKMKKEDLFKVITEFMEKNVLSTVASISANDFDLVQLGIAMRNAFDKELKNHISTIDCIVIENQISPIANRMKTLQGMIAQYFIMNNITKVEFISAANKLKGHIDLFETDISTYGARKKEGIKVMEKILIELRENSPENEVWVSHFKNHKKKDDLADAYLQGHWYLNRQSKMIK